VIGNTEELEEAIENGGTIILLDDVTSDDIAIPNGTNVTIDLDNYTLTAENSIENSGNAIYENGTMKVTANGVYGPVTTIGGNSTFNNVDVVTKGGGVNVWGTAVFNSGTVTTNSMSTSSRHVFYVAGGEGATGHLTINDGEFIFSPTNLTRKGSYICADGADATVIVNGGTFHKPSTRTAPIQALKGATVTIYGGTFAFDPSGFVADGYEAVEADGWWTVSAK